MADNGKKARDDVESSLKGFSKWLEEHAEELASTISDDFSYWGVGISQDLTIGDGGSATKVGINIRKGQDSYSSAFYLRD